MLLSLVHKGRQRLAQRSEPLSVIYELGKFGRNKLFIVHGIPVDAKGLEHRMSLVKNGSAGSLVNASRLHTHKSVFHNVGKADAVFAAQLIKGFDDFHGGHLFAVNGNGNTLFKRNSHIGGLVGSLLGRNAELKEAFLVILRLVGGILKIKTLMGKVPKVFIL